MSDEETKAVETPEEDKGIDNLAKTLEDFGELKEAQAKLDKKVDSIVEAIQAMTSKKEDKEEEAPKEEKKEKPVEKEDKEEDKEKEKKAVEEPKAISEDQINKAVEEKLAAAGIKLPSAKPTEKSGPSRKGHFDIIKKAIMEDGMTVQDIELRRNF